MRGSRPRSGTRGTILATVSGLALGVTFSPYGGPVLPFLAFAPLAAVLERGGAGRGRRPGDFLAPFAQGFAAAAIGHAIGLYWMVPALSWRTPLAVPLYLLMVGLLGLLGGCACMGTTVLRRRRWPLPVAVGLLLDRVRVGGGSCAGYFLCVAERGRVAGVASGGGRGGGGAGRPVSDVLDGGGWGGGWGGRCGVAGWGRWPFGLASSLCLSAWWRSRWRPATFAGRHSRRGKYSPPWRPCRPGNRTEPPRSGSWDGGTRRSGNSPGSNRSIWRSSRTLSDRPAEAAGRRTDNGRWPGSGGLRRRPR